MARTSLTIPFTNYITKPMPVTAPQRSAIWFAARLGCVTGSKAEETFLNISDLAKGAACREILQVKTLTPKIKETPDFIALWNMDAIELIEQAGMDIPETEKRKKYRQDVVGERFTHQSADQKRFMTPEMEWGVVNEPRAIAKYQMEKRIIVEEAPFFRHQIIDTDTGEVEQLMAGASPDGLLLDPTREEDKQLGVLECKCLRTGNHLFEIWQHEDMPTKYQAQVQMEMWITGRSFCDFIGYDERLISGQEIPELALFIKRIERDDKYISEKLEPSIRRFLNQVDSNVNYFYMRARQLKEERAERLLLTV